MDMLRKADAVDKVEDRIWFDTEAPLTIPPAPINYNVAKTTTIENLDPGTRYVFVFRTEYVVEEKSIILPTVPVNEWTSKVPAVFVFTEPVPPIKTLDFGTAMIPSVPPIERFFTVRNEKVHPIDGKISVYMSLEGTPAVFSFARYDGLDEEGEPKWAPISITTNIDIKDNGGNELIKGDRFVFEVPENSSQRIRLEFAPTNDTLHEGALDTILTLESVYEMLDPENPIPTAFEYFLYQDEMLLKARGMVSQPGLPGLVVLTSPSQNDSPVSATPEFNWERPANVTDIRLEITRQGTTTPIMIDSAMMAMIDWNWTDKEEDQDLDDTDYYTYGVDAVKFCFDMFNWQNPDHPSAPLALLNDSLYFWTVRARNQHGWATAVEVFTFFTGARERFVISGDDLIINEMEEFFLEYGKTDNRWEATYDADSQFVTIENKTSWVFRQQLQKTGF